jgi:hypothetical protein
MTECKDSNKAIKLNRSSLGSYPSVSANMIFQPTDLIRKSTNKVPANVTPNVTFHARQCHTKKAHDAVRP